MIGHLSYFAKGFKTKAIETFSLTSAFQTPYKVLGRRGLERLDLLLLVIESLDLNGSQAMIWNSHQLGFDKYFPNSVELWKARCHNPLRKKSRRGALKIQESEALISLLSSMATRLYPQIHQLLSKKEPQDITQARWKLFQERFYELVQERMNHRRGAVQRILHDHQTERIGRHLVLTLALIAGPGGCDRLRASLLDRTP